jgi:hypothetical protein
MVYVLPIDVLNTSPEWNPLDDPAARRRTLDQELCQLKKTDGCPICNETFLGSLEIPPIFASVDAAGHNRAVFEFARVKEKRTMPPSRANVPRLCLAEQLCGRHPWHPPRQTSWDAFSGHAAQIRGKLMPWPARSCRSCCGLLAVVPLGIGRGGRVASRFPRPDS